MAAAAKKNFEIHEHAFVSGRRSHGGYDHNGKWSNGTFAHSHENGSIPHSHPDTGPSSFTIDKDDWLRMTGLRGGGRKKFTAKPHGEQMPFIPRREEESSFEVHVAPPPTGWTGTGAGLAPVARMVLGFGMKVSKVVPFDPQRGRKRVAQ